jgi:two-component system, NtrC family, sensor kinase
MRRRSRPGGKPAESRRDKAIMPKRRNKANSVRGPSSAASAQETIARLTHERDDALEQLSATSDVLKVISSSPGDLKPVFEAILENAIRLCGGDVAALWQFDGQFLRFMAGNNTTPEAEAHVRQRPMELGTYNPTVLAGLERRTVHELDVFANPNYRPLVPSGTTTRRPIASTVIAVPLLREGKLLGVITIWRYEKRPFSDKQIELVTTFADQAVIAIENVRLFEAEQKRTAELAESLEQQTATSEVLSVISSSPGELEPVFQAVLEKATRICEAKFGTLYRFDGVTFYHAAGHGTPTALIEAQKKQGRFIPEAGTLMHQVMHTGAVAHSADYAAESTLGLSAKFGGARSTVIVPMLKDNELVGAFSIYRQEVRPFTDKQIELVQNFAAQAVIAIENTRLLNELRESLERQTATADVLKVISRSTFDLQVVLDTLVESAVQLCRADKAQILLPSENVDRFYATASYGYTSEYNEHLKTLSFGPAREGVVGRVLLERKPVQIADVLADADFRLLETQRLGEFRTHLGIPLLREGNPIGILVVSRVTVQPFDDKQIDLLTTFADQAVIAIENVRLFEAEQQRTAELTESLEQQTATAEVLKVISSSPGELEPVFNAMLENATRLCRAQFGMLNLYDGSAFRNVALHNPPPQFAKRLGEIIRPHPESGLAQVARTKLIAHIEDLRTGQPYLDGDKAVVDVADLGGARTVLLVPMLNEGKLIGAISIYRQEVRPFTDKQVELLQNFAAQAVIAIENTRLLNELRQSLEQQTATADVLKVISSSPGALEPVFQSMLANATRICEASFGSMLLREGDQLRRVAIHNAPPEFAKFHKETPVVAPAVSVALSRVMAVKQVVHIADLQADDPNDPIAKFAGARTILTVPLLKDNEVMGIIGIYRQEVQPFTDKQIALVQNFAAQAVIAIENTRLLNELRESLQQQMATGEVLKVISRSTFNLQSVLDTLVESATRLCEAQDAFIFLPSGNVYRAAARYGFTPEHHAFLDSKPIAIDRGSVVGRTAIEGRLIHISDVLADPDYTRHDVQNISGYRAALGAPLLREGNVIGVIFLARTKPQPFTDKQVELVATFADQAVIAIENARLLSELRQSLQQQTATADVLKVISRSTFDLKTVLSTLVESAARLCEADMASIPRQTGETFDHIATYGYSAEFQELLHRNPMSPGRGTVTGRAVLEGKTIHIPDVLDDPEYSFIEGQSAGGFRTVLGVPLMREGTVIGVLVLARSAPRPFTAQQIELVETFADQAVIAIENVRLFESVEARTRELGKSLEDLRTAQDRLVQTEKLASLGQLTAGIAHEIKNPLNFVNNFSSVSVELIDELRTALGGAHLDSELRASINEIGDMLQSNLDKVVQHGKRADSIVKNMLLHSRQGSAEHRPIEINALVEESLNLAYHGARAEKQGFNITLEKSFDPVAGEVDLFPQEITRVLLNLISNGFYAATKRNEETNEGSYEPTLTAVTKNLGHSVEIKIRDNGTGIPPEVKEKMFNPFFTTKPAGEGTGLGLSISHDIIVKQHGGSIEVDTKPGEFTEFRIVLPRTGMALSKSGEHV